jgi:hypoxanthine phosphoribosyltransferase
MATTLLSNAGRVRYRPLKIKWPDPPKVPDDPTRLRDRSDDLGLRGSFVFIADLVREIDLAIEVDFLEASSYGDSMESSREVRILKDIRGQIEGRDVLVVEDIVDTGHTLSQVTRYLLTRKPARLKTIALLDKPSRREVPFQADWIGFSIPDEFVVGYGIDYAQRNRNLPYIGKVRFI